MSQLRTICLSSSVLFVLFLSGCASMDMVELQQRLDAKTTENAALQKTIEDLRASNKDDQMLLEARNVTIGDLESKLATKTAMAGDGGPLLPPNAAAGECYARVFTPPQYKTVSKQVLKKEASERVQVIPATHKWVTEQVLVKEASSRLEVVPAKYNWVEEQVLVSEASEKIVTVPAVYKNASERILVRPAYTTWKKGRGPIEKIDHMTGEIMCLVEVPAEYTTVSKRVLASPASTSKMAIPASYNTVKKRVMVEPPKSRTVEIPAEYKTVRIHKMVSPASEKRISIPAEYQTVSERTLASDGNLQWRPILCETNTTPDVVRKLQRALMSSGHSPGPIDGVIGHQTMGALNSYQRSKGMPSGRLSIQSLKSLGVI